jgi:hypothetical protein
MLYLYLCRRGCKPFPAMPPYTNQESTLVRGGISGKDRRRLKKGEIHDNVVQNVPFIK